MFDLNYSIFYFIFSWIKFYCVFRQMLIIKLNFSNIIGKVTKAESKNIDAFSRTVVSQMPTLSSASCFSYGPVTEAQRRV